jgi:hypothetical protein
MSFDLNIKNYQKNELVEMFGLPRIYDKDAIENNGNKLKNNIINNSKIGKEIKSKIILFLQEAKKILLEDTHDIRENVKKIIERVYNTDSKLFPTKLEESNSHMIQEKPHTPYLSSYPSDFFPGLINPLKKRIIHKNLNIDTRFRDNYYSSQSSNYHLDLPIKLNAIVSMILSSIEIPTTFYTISKQLGNNFFVISIEETNETTVITIPDGNYNYSNLITYLNTTISSLSGYLKYIYFECNLSNNSGSGQVVVGIDDAFQQDNPSSDLFTFTLNFQTDKSGQEDRHTPLPLKFGWFLGFRNGVYVNNYTYVSEGVIDLSGPRYVYLVIDDYNNNVNNNFNSAFNSSLLNKNILARISLKGDTFNVLSENNLAIITYPRQYFGPVDIQKMHIQLLDEYGRILDLNNMDFSFCLTFQSTYDI